MEETSVCITQWKKPVWKDYRLCDSNNVTFCKRHNYGDGKDWWLPGVTGEVGLNRWNTEGFRAVKLLGMILRWWLHVTIHLPKLLEGTAPRVNPNVNYETWVITMHQCRFIHCSKYNSPMGEFDVRGTVYRWGERVCGKSLYLWLSFAVNLTLL